MGKHHIVVAGMGNTGSHLLPHLARMASISRITLVDPECYEIGNVAVQNIDRMDVGQPKVAAQANKLERIRPSLGASGLEVVALQERIEDAPRGLLKADLIVSCLDSRSSRQHVNEIAWRLGIPWIDCGVLGSQNLARVSTYAPGPDGACLECGWSHEDYALLEQEYLCGAGGGAAFPTMASSALGALAASLLAIEVAKILSGEQAEPVAARQVIVGAENHFAQVTASRRNPWCRFDHRTWHVEPWECEPEATALGAALDALGSLQVEGHSFVTELVCPGCGRRGEKSLRLNRPLARCAACNRRMTSSGFGSLERLNRELAGEFAKLTLAEIGLRAGDIVSGGGQHHRIHHRMLRQEAA
ncbi:MAG: ThiF family adenylyltransferase [Terracidiphilus sp.]|jgi:molybdopterin/thiamine biosynthesis adenylyltransferase